MPNGKPAGVACLHLMKDMRCAIFGQPQRPAVCASFKAMNDVCGDNRQQAIWLITELEMATS